MLDIPFFMGQCFPKMDFRIILKEYICISIYYN